MIQSPFGYRPNRFSIAFCKRSEKWSRLIIGFRHETLIATLRFVGIFEFDQPLFDQGCNVGFHCKRNRLDLEEIGDLLARPRNCTKLQQILCAHFFYPVCGIKQLYVERPVNIFKHGSGRSRFIPIRYSCTDTASSASIVARSTVRISS